MWKNWANCFNWPWWWFLSTISTCSCDQHILWLITTNTICFTPNPLSSTWRRWYFGLRCYWDKQIQNVMVLSYENLTTYTRKCTYKGPFLQNVVCSITPFGLNNILWKSMSLSIFSLWRLTRKPTLLIWYKNQLLSRNGANIIDCNITTIWFARSCQRFNTIVRWVMIDVTNWGKSC